LLPRDPRRLAQIAHPLATVETTLGLFSVEPDRPVRGPATVARVAGLIGNMRLWTVHPFFKIVPGKVRGWEKVDL
jgi:hypothetical protein